MSSVPTSRSLRRRILTVGEARLEGAEAGGPQSCENIFEALGQIAVAPASSPVDAVVLPLSDSAMEAADLVRAAEAVRRLDPTVQLVALVQDPPVPEIQAHVDFQVGLPLSLQGLEDLLDGRLAPGQPPVEAASDLDPEAMVPPPGMPAPPIGGPASAPSADPPLGGEGGLGDTDLVEALLMDPGQLRPRAIHLIQQQTGFRNVQIAEQDSAAAAPIRFSGRSFGYLSASGHAKQELRPWANWLARWLALEDAQATLRQMAYRDELTGAWNRRYLNHFLTESIEQARRMRRQLTVMVFDIDDFKTYNDRFGHDAGDIILRETIRLLGSVIRTGDRVCRVGGDEFAVVFADLEAPRTTGSLHPDSVETIARRFQSQIARMRFPRLGLQAPGTLSISGGLASFPWDASDPKGLISTADQRAMESKRRGKNLITIGPGGSFTAAETPPTSPTDPPR